MRAWVAAVMAFTLPLSGSVAVGYTWWPTLKPRTSPLASPDLV